MLNAKRIGTIREPGTHSDGPGRHGLMLIVTDAKRTGGLRKQWIQRLTIDRKRTNVGLGNAEFISLAEAREHAFENAKANARGEPLARGGDRRKGAEPNRRKIPTFRAAYEAWIAVKMSGPQAWRAGSSSERNVRAAFAHAAALDHRLISAITSADLIDVLKPLLAKMAPTARQLRGRMEQVFGWAIAHGHRADNPALIAIIRSAIPGIQRDKSEVSHRASRDFDAAPAMYRALDTVNSPARALRVLAARFAMLSGLRSKEVRMMRWTMVESDTLTVPGEVMKAGKAHRVPLASAAHDVLDAARKLNGGRGFVFGARGSDKPFGESAMRDLIQAIDAGQSVHGLRSMVRTWAESEGYGKRVSELCIAHDSRDATEGAYLRSDMLAERATIMQAWANFLTA